MFAWLKSLWPSRARRAERNLEVLSRLVLSRDTGTRAEAAAALGRTGDPCAVAPLIDALKNPIRSKVAEFEGGGKDDLPSRAAYTHVETGYIEDALVMLGTPAVDPLMEVWEQSGDGCCRRAARRVLVTIGDPRIVTLLFDVHADYSYSSAYSEDENHKDRDLRSSAQRALARIGDARIIEPLLKLWARKPEYMPPQPLLEVLVKTGDKRIIEPLMIAIVNADALGRENVLETLKQVDPAWRNCAFAKALMARLTSRLLSPDRPQRRAALGALDRIDPAWPKSGPAMATLPSAVAALKEGDYRVRAAAAELLRALKDERAVAGLVQALTDDNQEVRCAAAIALGAIRDLCAVEPLIAALRHPDECLRRTAADVLGDLQDARAVEPLRVAAAKDPHALTRDAATRSLAKIAKDH